MSPPPAASRLPALVTHVAVAALLALLLVAVGQPLFTDDAWWHLALGEAYAREGPWLARDPLLFTAPGAPNPTAWLFDLALAGLHRAAGFPGLRAVHVLGALAILALAWSLLRRAGGSPVLASLGVGVFAALAAYRLVQLRPHLLSILGVLLLYRILLEGDAPAGRRRVALAALLMALWANLHGAFLLGPALLAVALGGLLLTAPLRTPEQRARDRARAAPLAAALLLGLAATLLNPSGVEPHRAWFLAGGETPSLQRVADEWLPVAPLRLPVADLPPSPLSWGLQWALWVAAPLAGLRAVRRWRRRVDSDGRSADPALLALAGAALIAPLLAVRFLWLAIFPLLLLAREGGAALAGARARRPSLAAAAALAALLLTPGFLRLGDWPMLTRALPGSWSGYAQPYPAARYFGHAVWMLDDAGLEGNLFNEYFLGGFLGFWLAPELRAFANGTLNLSPEAMRANLPLRERRGEAPGEGFLELLDRHRVDLFLGIRIPRAGPPHRPWFHTTRHLEGAPGWRPVFRNLRSAVYLRDAPRNRANLERVAAYYARERVPFDPARGFDAARVLDEAPGWATAHGLVPADFAALRAAARGPGPGSADQARNRLASVYAALGLYGRAVELDRLLVEAHPDAAVPRRRLAWSLLHLGRAREAAEHARALEARPPEDWLSHRIAATARRAAEGWDAETEARVARLPFLSRTEGARLLAGYAPPPARTRRR